MGLRWVRVLDWHPTHLGNGLALGEVQNHEGAGLAPHQGAAAGCSVMASAARFQGTAEPCLALLGLHLRGECV